MPHFDRHRTRTRTCAQASRFDEASLQARLKTSDAVVYMVGQGRGVKVPEFKRRLERMAEASGGRALLVDDPEGLDEAFQNIVLELSHQYVLGYTPTNAARDGSWRRIEVEVANERHRLRYREGIRRRPAANRSRPNSAE